MVGDQGVVGKPYHKAALCGVWWGVGIVHSTQPWRGALHELLSDWVPAAGGYKPPYMGGSTCGFAERFHAKPLKTIPSRGQACAARRFFITPAAVAERRRRGHSSARKERRAQPADCIIAASIHFFGAVES